MIETSTGPSTAAAESGRICAVAARAQRDLWKWTKRYGGVFGGGPFDLALLNSVCLGSAFSAPWLTSAELGVTNRATLWALAAASQGDVRGCVAVADGAAPIDDDDLTRSLADIRDELSRAPAFPALRPVWRDELRLFLDETAGRGRDVSDLALGGFCLVSHWISTAERTPPESAVRSAIRSPSDASEALAGHPRMLHYLESQADFHRGFSRSER